MPADEFVEMVSGAKMFGDPLLRTQHLVGSSKWEKTSDIEIFGLHQVRSGSLRSNGANKEDAVFESYRTLIVQHWYRKVDDVWKLAGIKPLSR
jgi:scytalone dehydratase